LAKISAQNLVFYFFSAAFRGDFLMWLICSIGPKINNPTAISELYHAGMNMMRFNFSHISYHEADELISFCRTHFPDFKIFQDLQGPKLRVSPKFHSEIQIFPEQEVTFCSEKEYEELKKRLPGSVLVPILCEENFSALHSAKAIFMKDGTMKFRVTGQEEELLRTVVEQGGVIRAQKGINAPGMGRQRMALSSKDKKDILWGLSRNLDVVCLSYVCAQQNVIELKEFIEKNSRATTPMPQIWAKIETQEGVDNFTSIVESADGIVLGRGDLTAEIGKYNVPKVQKRLLEQMKTKSKDFIIATFVLESMRYNLSPYIPELNDIYDCLLHNVTGFILCAETAVGKYPLAALKTLIANVPMTPGSNFV
jgi:pyruvate kinase